MTRRHYERALLALPVFFLVVEVQVEFKVFTRLGRH